MNITQNANLLASVPIEELLIVGSVFLASALILFALAVEAGTYPGVSAALHRLREKVRRNRHSDPGSGFLGGNRGHEPLHQG